MGLFDLFNSNKRSDGSSPEVPVSPPPEPPLLYAEIPLEHTHRCADHIFEFAKIEIDGRNVGIDEAVELYYSSPDRIFVWSFETDDLSFTPYKKTYVVSSRGYELGEVSYSKYNPHHVEMINRLLNNNAIVKSKAIMKRSKWFALSEDEYKQYVKDDPYNRGWAAWAGGSPEINIYLYFKKGSVSLEGVSAQYDMPLPEDFDL